MDKTALVGYGYWGKNIFRILVNILGIENVYLVEKDAQKLNDILKIYPILQHSLNHETLADLPDVKNVVLATPTPSHYELAKFFLRHDKHVLIEKPSTLVYQEAVELGKIALERNLSLLTDYTYLYNPAVRKIKSLIDQGELGRINYIDCTRINLGIYQMDTNVLWDLACHDISIVNYLIREKPAHIRAVGRVNRLLEVEDLAYIFLHYESGLLVQINSSWSSPVKIRQIVIGGDSRMLIFDDLEPANKLKIYDYLNSSLQDDPSKKGLAEYRLGNISSPILSTEEPLNNVLLDFLKSGDDLKHAHLQYQETLDIIKYLEKANESLQNNGILVSI